MGNKIRAWFLRHSGFEENLTFEKMRAQLLKLFLFIGFLISGFSSLYQLVVLIFFKNLFNSQYVIYSTISTISLLILWLIGRKHYRIWYGYIFLLLVIFFVTLIEPNEYIRFVGIYVCPILVASFILRPSCSLLMAFSSLVAYTSKYFINANAFHFNYFILIVFFLPALVSWLIAQRLQSIYENSQNIAKKYETFIEQTPGAIYICEYSPEPWCVYASSQLKTILGYDPDAWMRDPQFWRTHLHPDDRDWVVKEDDLCARKGEPFHAEYRMIKNDHSTVWVSDDAYTKLENGKPFRMQGVIQDITKRKKTDQIQSVIQKVSQSLASGMSLEQLYHFIHQSLGELMPVDNIYIALYDPIKNLIEFPYHVDQFDQTPEPYPPGKGLTEYVMRSAKPLLASPEGLDALVKAGEVRRVGSASLDWLGVPLIVENQTIGVMAVQTYTEGIRFSQADLDVLSVVSTQIALVIYRKRIEEKLHASEETYRTLVDASPDVIIVTDMGGNIQFASPHLKNLMHLNDATPVIGTRLKDWVVPEEQNLLLENLQKVLTGEIRFNTEYTLISKTGFKIAAEANSSPLRDTQAQITGAVTIWRDITQRKQAEKIQSVIFKVSQSASASLNLDELYSFIHHSLSELMPVDIFYIALYDAQQNLMEFPYYIDQFDEKPDPYPPGKGLTEYVMRTGKPLLASLDGLETLVKAGEVRRVGSLSLDWLGVPLIVENQTIGVMAVQTYAEGVRFSQADLEILSVVSTQIALVIYRKRIEEKLNASEEMYRTLVEASPDIIIVSDLENKITYTSQHLQDLLPQLKVDDVIGTDLIGWIAKEDRQKAYTNFQRVFRGERVVNEQYSILTPSGRRVAIEANSGLLRDSKGSGAAIVTILRDITERRMIENALRESENRYHGIFNGVRDAIFVESLDGKILDFNDSAMMMYGYSREHLLRLPVSALVPPSYQPITVTDESAMVAAVETVNVRSNGEVFPIELSITKQQIGDEAVLLVVVRDVTERRQAGKIQSVISKVAQSTSTSRNLDDLYGQIHRALGELMPVDNFYIALYDSQQDLMEFPYYKDQFDGTPAPHPPGNGLTEYVMRTAKPLLASPEGLEALVQAGEVRRIGSPSLDWLGVPLIVENRTFGVMAVQTYTEGIRFSQADLNVLSVVSSQVALAIFRKQIEEKLNESEEMYRTLVEASPDVIIVADQDGNITFASQHFQDLLQIKSLEDVIGTNLLEWVAPEDQQRVLGDFKRVFEGERVVNAQFTLITASGKKIASESNSGLLRGNGGRQNAIVTILREITQRKKAENQLRDALEEKEILVREVHHRVKNNLQIMSSLLSFQQDGISDATAKNALQEAQNRIRSMAYIHEGLYQSKNLAMIDLPAYIQKLVDNLVDLFGVRKKVQIRLDITDITTGIDAAIPCGLIVNELVSNSLKYAFEGRKKGILSVRLQNNEDSSIPQKYVLSVIDNGIGMPSDWDQNSSKTLGLQLVNILVKQLKGEIQLLRDKGTTFNIYFSEKANDNSK
jgi:PAS domain S-box-containing protein